MEKIELDKNGDFLVRESSTTNIVVGIFFFVLFAICMFNILDDGEQSNQKKIKISFAVISLLLVPAILSFVKGVLHKTIIKINSSGIFVLGKLKTNWLNFICANVEEVEVPGSIKDNFVLVLQFCKKGEEGYFVTRIPLTSTMDKSGEEVIASVNYFRELAIKQTE